MSLVTGGDTHRNLEIHHLLGKCRHLVVEAELVLADALRRENKVALSLLRPVYDDLVARRGDGEVDIERTTGLDLYTGPCQKLLSHILNRRQKSSIEGESYTNRKVESDLGVDLLNVGEEACLLIGFKPVGQGSCGDRRDQRGQSGQKSESHGAGILCLWTVCQEFWTAGRSDVEFALFAPKQFVASLHLYRFYSSYYGNLWIAQAQQPKTKIKEKKEQRKYHSEIG